MSDEIRPVEIIPFEMNDYFDMEEVKLYPINVGDIILYNSIGDSLYGNLQKDVQDIRGTKYELTHSSIGWVNLNISGINIKNEQQVYEAKEAMTVTFWDRTIYNPKMEFWVYRFNNVPDKVLKRVAYAVKRKTDGEPYGFLQILYFEREAFYKQNFVGKLIYPIAKIFHGGKEIEQWGNWFPSGFICSELVYLMMLGVAIEMNYKDLSDYMKKWSQDNISPAGILKIIENFPQYFQLVHKKIIQEWRK